MNPKSLIALPLLAVTAVLASCTPVEPEPETYATVPPVEEPIASVTPNAIEPDTALVVRAVVTTGTGDRFDLEMHVHTPKPWNDIATQTLPQAMIEDCGGEITAQQLEQQAWSFARINITVIPANEQISWPSGASVALLPTAGGVSIAGRGILLQEEAGPTCHLDKAITDAGRGGMAVGFVGDAANGLSAWTGLDYGFITGEGLTLSDCTFTVTDIAAVIPGVAWTEVTDPGVCTIGG